MADNLTVHQRNTLVHRTPLHNKNNYETDEDGFSNLATTWTGSKFERVPVKDHDFTDNCHHQLTGVLLKDPTWKDKFRRSALSENLNVTSNPEYGLEELEASETNLPKFTQVTKLHWDFFNTKCVRKFQADNPSRYQLDWPIESDHGQTVNLTNVFGIDLKQMNENLMAVKSHQITNEKGETHRPYRQLSHRLSKQPATIPSIRMRHDPSVVAHSFLQDAIVAEHLDDTVKLTPAADLLKIIIHGSPLIELYQKTIMMITVAELTFLPARQDLILKSMESQLEDKVIRQFVSTVLMGATPSMLDGFTWRSIYMSRDKKKVIDNIRQLQQTAFELRDGPSTEEIQTEVEKLFQGLCQKYQQQRLSLEGVYNRAQTLFTDNRYFDKAATVLADVLYTINYEPNLIVNRHCWLLADAPLYRRLQRIRKDKLTTPEVPVSTIMATQASLVAVTTIMNEANKLMKTSVIEELYNPQVFIEPTNTVKVNNVVTTVTLCKLMYFT